MPHLPKHPANKQKCMRAEKIAVYPHRYFFCSHVFSLERIVRTTIQCYNQKRIRLCKQIVVGGAQKWQQLKSYIKRTGGPQEIHQSTMIPASPTLLMDA